MSTKIKDWAKFQHFKDRRPPWVKLYRDILDDVEWHELDGDAAKVLVMLWLIGSEDGGKLPDVKKLSFRLRISENKLTQLLNKLDHWLIHDDINSISGGYQDDTAADKNNSATDIEMPLRDRDRDRDREETERAGAHPLPDGLDPEAWERWKDYRKQIRKPLKPVSIPAAQLELAAFGSNQAAVVQQSIANGWQGLFALKTAQIAKLTVAHSAPVAQARPFPS